MAAHRQKRVPTSAVDALIKELGPDMETVRLSAGNAVLEIHVKKQLTLQDYCGMVNTAVECRFSGGPDGACAYSAALSRCAKDLAVLAYLTDLRPETGSEKLYLLTQQTDLMDQIKLAAGAGLLERFERDVDSQTEYRKAQQLCTGRRELAEAAGQLEKAADAFNRLSETISGTEGARLTALLEQWLAGSAAPAP